MQVTSFAERGSENATRYNVVEELRAMMLVVSLLHDTAEMAILVIGIVGWVVHQVDSLNDHAWRPIP